MAKQYERGFGHFVVFLIGGVLVLFLIGFFRTDQPISQITYKKLLRLPCGLTFKSVEEEQKVTFPLKVYGYINECGWVKSGHVAGTAQIFDSYGQPITNKANLNISDAESGYPYYFENSLVLSKAPQTDKGSLILNSTSGLYKAIPVSFLR